MSHSQTHRKEAKTAPAKYDASKDIPELEVVKTPKPIDWGTPEETFLGHPDLEATTSLFLCVSTAGKRTRKELLLETCQGGDGDVKKTHFKLSKCDGDLAKTRGVLNLPIASPSPQGVALGFLNVFLMETVPGKGVDMALILPEGGAKGQLFIRA